MFQKVLDFLFTKEVYSEVETYYTPTLAANILLFLVIVIILVALAAFSGSQIKLQVKQLTFCAMAIAIGVVTSFIKFAHLPFGGSITLFSMFFVCLIGYMYGAKVGITTGIAYGLLQLMIDPMIMHPVQVLLDYPLAFGFLGITGAFSRAKNGLLKGYVLGVFGRYLCHVISGFIFFWMYAPEGMNTVVYAFGYNATYILPEAIATIALLLVPAIQRGLLEVKRMAVLN
jgi:thiamine transporter